VSVKLIPASIEDIPKISHLANTIWNQHYPSVITQDQIDYMLRKNYNSSALLAQIEEGQQFFMITNLGENVGFLSISEKEDTTHFIHKFYIDLNAHNQGIGKSAFGLLLQEMPAIKTIRLQVNRKNYKPINFYFKLGFKIEYVADFDIGNGYFMNDFVMVWNK
jgi:ribosomal protein S18 acetylase RimI-like enzyme